LPFLMADTVGFIRKLPHDLVESFKSTLDEVRESDLLIHVVDISHPNFEEHIHVVHQTLREIEAFDKPMLMMFNKIDAYHFIKRDEDDLRPAGRENLSLNELKRSWMARSELPSIFISAKEKQNVEEFKELLYKMVKDIHVERYPYNNFLY